MKIDGFLEFVERADGKFLLPNKTQDDAKILNERDGSTLFMNETRCKS
jgi:hypothetical protein